MKILVVIDVQNDFVDGRLGTKEAINMIPNLKEKIILILREKLIIGKMKKNMRKNRKVLKKLKNSEKNFK